jgi:flagellar protein FlbD
MIPLTRLNGEAIAVNCDLVERIEATPDTTLRLLNGQSLVVRESLDEVVESIAAWRARILARAGLGALAQGERTSGVAVALAIGCAGEGSDPCPDDVEEAA